jgi:DNA-binding beta-propeller fold protein YncE
MAWDNESNDVYVTCLNESLSNVFPSAAVLDVISAGNLQLVSNVSLGPITPDGIAYVPSLDELFVANNALDLNLTYSSPSLTVISTLTNMSIATIPLPATASTAGEVVFDKSSSDLYVAGAGLQFYSENPYDLVVNPETRSVVGSISVGTNPNAITPDPASNSVFAASAENGTVSLINGSTGEAAYSVTLPVGDSPVGLAFDQAGGQLLAVDWSNDTVTYWVPRETYPVTFSETGLPGGQNWSVAIGNSTVYSQDTTLSFAEPNGTFAYSIFAAGGGYVSTNAHGIFTVHGVAVFESTTFVRPTYFVSFDETGLGSGLAWSVNLNGTVANSTAAEIQFAEVNGSYPFIVGGPLGYAASPASGSVKVNGSHLSVSITFASVQPPLQASAAYREVSAAGLCGPPGAYSLTVRLFGNGSGGSLPYTFAWTFGDGSPASAIQDPEHTYANYPEVATLTVTDHSGNHSSTSVTIQGVTATCTSRAPILPASSLIVLGIGAGLGLVVGLVAYRRKG